jgi:multiple sugar transport system ATP-binding protein
MGKIELKGVEKAFGAVKVIQGVDLLVEDGSFVVFVGPSGCGKSTLLRLIAGLEDATGGAILIDGEDVIDQPPAQRGLSMVFQSYALYPHMTVRNNIGFGLRMAGVPKAERDAKVEEAAQLLNLTPYLDRRPGALSGGQRQRVAIARALIGPRRLVLADEPTGALDSQSGEAVLRVLRARCDAGASGVLVTHEARLAGWADRVVFLRDGEIVDDTGPAMPVESLLPEGAA